MFGSKRVDLAPADEVLPDREQSMPVPPAHEVTKLPLTSPFPEGSEIAYFGMGCFWGAESGFWKTPGVLVTAVGYQGGVTKNPTYGDVCSGKTNHTEVVLACFSPSAVTFEQLLKIFWEGHDPTQGMRQGNDKGSQYRSAIYTTTELQLEQALNSRDNYQRALTAAGFGQITTEIKTATDAGPFYYAEPDHQQYLHKVPYGYCGHGETGVSCPIGLTVAAELGNASNPKCRSSTSFFNL